MFVYIVFNETTQMFKTAPPKSLQSFPAQKQGSAIIGQWQSTSEMSPKFSKSVHVEMFGKHKFWSWLVG